MHYFLSCDWQISDRLTCRLQTSNSCRSMLFFDRVRKYNTIFVLLFLSGFKFLLQEPMSGKVADQLYVYPDGSVINGV